MTRSFGAHSDSVGFSATNKSGVGDVQESPTASGIVPIRHNRLRVGVVRIDKMMLLRDLVTSHPLQSCCHKHLIGCTIISYLQSTGTY